MMTHSTATKTNGIHYFFKGWKLISLPGIRRFVIIPLIVNFLLMGIAFVWLFSELGHWVPTLMFYVPGWLQWLSYVLWPVAIVTILLVFSYFFSTIANWIAAPFCGLLSEQLEAKLTGSSLPEARWGDVIKDIPRVMKRELQKLVWYLPRAAALFVGYFVPGLGQTAIPLLWFLFTAWMLSIQYCDYPFDNHKISFRKMRVALRQHKTDNMQFGALVSLFTMIPLLNLVIMPVAVCGATAMWIDRYKACSGK